MVKQSKSVYVLGSIVIGIITIIAVLSGLMLSGVIDASSKKLVFTSVSEEIVYNGEMLTCDEWVLDGGELKDGHVAVLTFTGNQEEVGESDNSFVVIVVDENGADVTADYEITTHFGKLKVLPRPLTMLSGDAVEEYNGTAVKNLQTSITSGELMAGHTVEYIVTGTRTDAGVSENTFVAVIRDEDGKDVTKNYQITYTFGKIEVLPMKVAILSADRTVEYDGTEHSAANDVWSYASATKRPAEGLEVEVVFSGEITDVGSVDKKLASVVVTDNGRDVTFNYEFTYVGGKITIGKKPITITTLGDKKPHDGTPLVKDGLAIIDGGLAEDHEISSDYVITGSQTDVGKSDNTVEEDTVRIVDKNGNDVTDNYDITIETETLEVTDPTQGAKPNSPGEGKQPDDGGLTPEQLETVVAKITTNYSGTLYLRRESFLNYVGISNWTDAGSVVYNGLLDNTFGMNYLVGAGIRNGEYVKSRKAEIEVLFDDVGYILPYYQSTLQTGVYTVQTSDVLNAGSIDGTYSCNYFPSDYKCVMSGTLNGYSDEELAYRKHVHENYLTMDDADVELLCMKLSIEKGWILDEKSVTEIISEVADYVKTLAKYDMGSTLDDDSDNIVYDMLTNDGTYTALCRHYASVGVALLRVIGIPARYTTGYLVNVKEDEQTEIKIKDGHAWVEAYLDGIGWVHVECTAPADSPNGEQGGQQTSKNVSFTPKKTVLKYQSGLSVDPIDSVTGNENWGKFKEKGYTVDVNVVFNGIVSDPGIYQSEIDSLVIYDKDGNDVTSEFTVEKKTGIIQLYIYEITVKTESADKIYDGTELTYSSVKADKGYTLSGDSELSSYNYEVTLTGKQTEVGQTSNTAKVKITEKVSGKDVTDLFNIERDYGVLKVNLRPLTLRAGSLEEVYEAGKVLTISSDDYQVVSGTTVDGHKLFAVVKGSLSSAGYSYTYFESVEIRDVKNGGAQVTDQYEIILIGGTLFMPFE